MQPEVVLIAAPVSQNYCLFSNYSYNPLEQINLPKGGGDGERKENQW